MESIPRTTSWEGGMLYRANMRHRANKKTPVHVQIEPRKNFRIVCSLGEIKLPNSQRQEGRL